VETHRVNTLHPGGVLDPQIHVRLQQCPAFQHVCRWDPALRQPVLLQQLTQQPGVRPVGLGPPLPAPRRGGLGRFTQMRLNVGCPEFLDHIPPAGTGLDRERDIVAVGEILP
jgi:hypothetical protein